MIELYAWTTPNNRKVSAMLEEAQLDYAIHRVDLTKGEQFSPEFLKISPNNKTPAIIDRSDPGRPVTIYESGAILIHLAEKAGRFLPAHGETGRGTVLEWLFWQVGGFGPMLGQYRHFAARPEQEAAHARFKDEARRLFGVLDKRLGEARYLAGEAFSIADIAAFPWSLYVRGQLEQALSLSHPNIARWEAELAMRPALARGMAALS